MDNKGFIVEQTVMAANKNIEEVKAVIEGEATVPDIALVYNYHWQ